MPVVDPANNPAVTVTPLIVDPAGRRTARDVHDQRLPQQPVRGRAARAAVRAAARSPRAARAPPSAARCATRTAPHLAADAGRWPVPAERSSRGVADDRAARGRVHGRHLSRSVRQPARRLRSRHAAHARHQGRRGDASRSARSSGCSTGPGASTTPRWPTRRRTIDSSSGFYDRDEATFEPIGRADARSRRSTRCRRVVDAGVRSIWIMPSRREPRSRSRRRSIDPDTHRAVPFTVERETLRYRFFATAGTFAPANTSSEPQPGVRRHQDRSASNRNTRCRPPTRSRPTRTGRRW